MSSTVVEPVRIVVSDTVRVSGLLQTPPGAWACYVFAHGAGAGMDHPFMVEVARELALRGVATLRYQFPYMERGAKRPDPPQLAQATVRAAVAAALDRLPGLQTHCRRQIVRRPDDIASSGESCATRRMWTGIPRLSASSSRSAIGRTAPCICLKSKFRCCFCKVPAIG